MKNRRFVPLTSLFCVLSFVAFFLLMPLAFAKAPQELPERFKTGASRPTLLEFYAQWCSTCKRMEPIINKIEYDTGKKLRLIRLDIDRSENERLAKRYSINGTPTYFLYNKEGKLVFTMSELISSSLLQTMVYKEAGVIKAIKLPKRRGESFKAIENNKKPLMLISFHEKECVSCSNANGFTGVLKENFSKELSILELDIEDEGVKRYMKNFSLRSVPSYALIDQDGFLLFQQDKALEGREKKSLWQYLKLIQSGLPTE